MIQRIQSIFLFLTSAAFFALFAVPFARSTEPMKNFFSDMIFNIQDHIVLMILAGLGGLVALANIFLFRNRPLQIKLGYMLITLGIILPVVAALLIMNDGSPVEEGVEVSDGLGLYVPVAILLFAGLSVYFIKKDEKLVRSMDRLR